MSRVLLIGKTGQLGGEILKQAADFGFEVVAPDSNELDVLNPAAVSAHIKKVSPAWIINASAYNATTKAEEEPQAAMALNFSAVYFLAQYSKEAGAKFVTYSTDYVFDGKKGSPYTEEDCPNPLQVYGISKLAGEYAAQNYDAYVIRTCGLYGGKEGSPVKGNVVLNFLKEAKGKEVIEVASDQFASPTSAKNLAEATFALMQKDASPGVYHLVNEGHCSWQEFVKEIFSLYGLSVKVEGIERKREIGVIKRPVFSVLVNERAKKLGVVLPLWQEGLREYITFLKTNGI